MKTLNKTLNKTSHIVFLFAFTYFISYITRINFGAVISEMVTDTGFSKTALSLAITGSAVTYGGGQIVSGICGDRFRPKKLVLAGLLLSSAINVLVPFCSNPVQMTVLWCVNGFAQSFMWPPIVALLTQLVPFEEYGHATVRISWGSAFGTILIYLTAPLMIYLSGWRSLFWLCAALGLVMCFVWQRLCPEGEASAVKKSEVKSEGNKISLLSPLMILIMLAIVFQGALRDGVTTWMPSYIAETYKLGNAISILTGVLLPVFSLVCFHISEKLNNKVFTNPLMCAGVIFATGTASAIFIYLFTGTSAALSVAFTALLAGCMHGVNLMLICMIPAYFKKSGKVSTVSGVLNSCTYIGSALSTFGIALISDKLGWSATIVSWFVIALLGTLMCFIGYGVNKKSKLLD